MKTNILILATLLFSLFANAQTRITADAIPETREIVLNADDTIQKIHIFITNPNLTARTDRFYAWYQKQLVLHTQGAWSGKLLQGPYEAYYPNHNLLEQGAYEKGWKIGRWHSWYPDGTLKEYYTWKNGVQHGTYQRFDATGALIEEGAYRHGLRHGKTSTFSGDATTVERYRKGQLVVKKTKTDRAAAQAARKTHRAAQKQARADKKVNKEAQTLKKSSKKKE